MTLAGSRIGKKFYIERKIGAGSFGTIYEGTDLNQNDKIAIKVELPVKKTLLHHEAKIIKHLSKNGATGIPRFRWYGKVQQYNMLVMDLLGKSLEELYAKRNRHFSLKTVLLLADQMIKRVEFMHNKCILHRDIKPDNFLMGRDQKSHIVFLVDFGLSKIYMRHGVHISFRDKKSLTGTLRYASVNTHLGYEQSRRDDLECLGYVLIYFLKKQLPWQGLKAKTKKEKYKVVQRVKSQTKIKDLCSGIPEEFAIYLQYCRTLSFEDEPDYKYLRRLFMNLFQNRNFKRVGLEFD